MSKSQDCEYEKEGVGITSASALGAPKPKTLGLDGERKRGIPSLAGESGEAEVVRCQRPHIYARICIRDVCVCLSVYVHVSTFGGGGDPAGAQPCMYICICILYV